MTGANLSEVLPLEDMEPERYNEKCGVFGAFNVLNASHTCYYGMVGLQHRGQEGGGMVRTRRLHVLCAFTCAS